jgi:hypothetical protein
MTGAITRGFTLRAFSAGPTLPAAVVTSAPDVNLSFFARAEAALAETTAPDDRAPGDRAPPPSS